MLMTPRTPRKSDTISWTDLFAEDVRHMANMSYLVEVHAEHCAAIRHGYGQYGRAAMWRHGIIYMDRSTMCPFSHSGRICNDIAEPLCPAMPSFSYWRTLFRSDGPH